LLSAEGKNIIDLKEQYKALHGKMEQSMGWLAVVQQAMNDRAAAGVGGGVVPTADGVVPVVDGGNDQQWPTPSPGLPPQAHGQVHGQARQAEAVRNRIPIPIAWERQQRQQRRRRPSGLGIPSLCPQLRRRGRPLQPGQLIHSHSRCQITGSRHRKPCRYIRYSSNSRIQAQHTDQAPRGHRDQARVLVTSQTPLTGRHSSCRHTAACGTSRSNSSRETAPDS
jgi:hypothetical protein